VTATQTMADYKEFGGLRLPTRTTLKMAGLEQILIVQAVEFDTVSRSAFDLPADIKTLLRAR
jgi:hypothetical protein